ncbi:hypothetical protein ACXIVK_27880 [Paraburkholderia caledonica]|jgi:hypothetical protein
MDKEEINKPQAWPEDRIGWPVWALWGLVGLFGICYEAWKGACRLGWIH